MIILPNVRSQRLLTSSLFACLALMACSSSSSSSNDTSSREQARSYARGSVVCVTDADCCVVIDRCINQGLVVRASDKDKVAALVAEPDPRGCTGCLLPAVQVSCVSGQCAGTLIEPSSSPDAGIDTALYSSLTKDHCGSIAGVTTKSAATGVEPQALVGCGPQ